MSSFNENVTSAFYTNQVFKSRDDLMTWVQDVGRSLGYVIVTKRSKTDPDGYIYKVVLRCDRGGIFKSKQSEKGKESGREVNSKKCNCPFELTGLYSKINDFWTLRVIRDEHNHQPALYMEGHSHSKRLTNDEFDMLADLTMKNVKPRDILSTLKKENKDNVSTLK